MFIVDGHNLIPKIRGLSLRDIDDEERLIDILKEYARLRRKTMVVFFDGAPPGQAGERNFGPLQAHFVPLGRTADDAIRRHLESLGKAARMVTVVSSDRQVRANAHELHARVMTSEEFARQLADLRDLVAEKLARAALRTPKVQPKQAQKPPGQEAAQAPSEMDEWLALFGVDPAQADQPIDLSKKPPRKTPTGRHKPDGPPEKSPSAGGAKKRQRPHHGFPRKSDF